MKVKKFGKGFFLKMSDRLYQSTEVTQYRRDNDAVIRNMLNSNKEKSNLEKKLKIAKILIFTGLGLQLVSMLIKFVIVPLMEK